MIAREASVDDDTFRTRCAERLGPLDEAEVERAIGATLRVLGEACSRRLLERLARALPRSPGAILADLTIHDLGGDASALAARTARREGIPTSLALEQVTAVASVVGECLDEETMALVRSELSPDVAALLEPRELGPPPPRPEHPAGPRSTLSEGRPGSAEPVSRVRHPLTHVDSVAGVAHEDEHLSGARGTRQEQHHHTLAEGHSKRS